MATISFNNGTEGDFGTATSWVGGVAPGTGDTAVVDSTGDQPASLAGNGNIFTDLAGDTVADLTGNVVIEPDPVFFISNLSNPPISTEYFPDTPAAAAQTPGETIDNETIDLLGGGSVASLFLQNSTLGPATTLDVSGTALLDAEFSDTLSGTVAIGAPVLVNGLPVTPPAPNANGAVDELDINLRPAGSWTFDANTGRYAFSGYLPTTTNSGTITVGAESAFRVQMAGQNPAPVSLVPNQIIADPPEATAFVNAGRITVGAGGSAGFYTEVDTPVGNAPGVGTPLETVTNTGAIAVDGASGANTDLLVQAAFSGGTVIVDGGTAATPGATAAEFDNVVSNTNFVVSNGKLTFGLDNGATSGGTLGVGYAGQVTGGSITFGGNGVLALYSPNPIELDTINASVTTPINDFAAGDAIQLTLIPGLNSAISTDGTFSFAPVWNQSTHQLQIVETLAIASFFGGGTATQTVAQFTLDGTYDPSSFAVAWSPDPFDDAFSTGGSSVTVTITTTQPAPCFVAGTRIATPSGEVPVENLRPGHAVRLADGTDAVVTWVGHRRCEDRPVRVRAGALAPNVPVRDLVVSADHALFLDGLLVPAGLLVDDRTILLDPTGPVTYHHVELERHAVLLAEGAPAESYLDTGNRARFGNCPLGYDPIEAAANDPCAEVLFGGPRLDALRTRLTRVPAPV